MVSEYTILWTAFGALIGLSIASLLYALGGREGKWKRRFLASLTLSTTVNVCCLVMGIWVWQLVFIYPILITGFSLGYGAETTLWKIIRRSIYALCVISSGLMPCFFIGGNCWFVLPVHIGVGLFSVWLGVKNPIYASAEELFVCALLNIGLCAYPFVGKL